MISKLGKDIVGKKNVEIESSPHMDNTLVPSQDNIFKSGSWSDSIAVEKELNYAGF